MANQKKMKRVGSSQDVVVSQNAKSELKGKIKQALKESGTRRQLLKKK